MKLETNQKETLKSDTASFCDPPALLPKHRRQCKLMGCTKPVLRECTAGVRCTHTLVSLQV